mmetsp:Transcript_19383/g.41950  ORF Transcript_19383/g.41950 Transcript_19383/m.41950 type:complete len:86 (+) Transcript_19383:649-906(+)
MQPSIVSGGKVHFCKPQHPKTTSTVQHECHLFSCSNIGSIYCVLVHAAPVLCSHAYPGSPPVALDSPSNPWGGHVDRHMTHLTAC